MTPRTNTSVSRWVLFFLAPVILLLVGALLILLAPVSPLLAAFGYLDVRK